MTVSYTILCYQVTDLFPKEGQLCEKRREWKWLKQSGYSVTEWDPAGPLAANEWLFWGFIRFSHESLLPWGKWHRSEEWQHLQVTDARIHQASVHTVTQAVTLVSQFVKPDCIFIFGTKFKVSGSNLFFIPATSVTDLLSWPLALNASRRLFGGLKALTMQSPRDVSERHPYRDRRSMLTVNTVQPEI